MFSGSLEVTHWAEVMIEGNKTLDVTAHLSGLIGTILDTTGVTITNAEIAAGKRCARFFFLIKIVFSFIKVYVKCSLSINQPARLHFKTE